MSKNLRLANTLKIEFLSGSYTHLDTSWSCKEASFPFTRLYYIYKGSGILYCKGQTISMEPGNMYLLPADLPVMYKCPEYMEQLFLHITLTTPEGFDLLSGISQICQAPCSQPFLEQLKTLLYSQDYCQLLEFKTRVTQTVVDSLQEKKLLFPTKLYSLEVLQAIAYVQNNISVQLTGEQVAQAICVSPSFLHKHFKEETGLTLGAYLDKLIFHQATVLLAERKLSLKEISQQLGFCDQYYFSRRFKAQMGTTPSLYRKHHLNLL